MRPTNPPEPEAALVESPHESPDELASQLRELVMRRDALKKAVADAQAALDANTFAIAELIPGPEAGQKTRKVSEDLKVTVKRELIFTVDASAMRKFCMANPVDPIFPPLKVKTVEELDTKGYKWYQANHPQLFAQLAEFVSAKPAKVAVEVKPAKKQ